MTKTYIQYAREKPRERERQAKREQYINKIVDIGPQNRQVLRSPNITDDSDKVIKRSQPLN